MMRTIPTITVVDDDQAVCNSLRFSLALDGFDVRTYFAPSQLLSEWNLADQGCLVLDFRLPEMTGLQLLKRLREREVLLPAIIMTTNPSSNLREEVQDAGAGLVEKPLLGDTLLYTIRSSLRMQEPDGSRRSHQRTDCGCNKAKRRRIREFI